MVKVMRGVQSNGNVPPLGALACRTGQDRKLTCEKETTDSFLYSTAVAPKYMY
jgi:hypothetical protein